MARSPASAPPVGHRLRARRRALGQTQAALAQRAGISPAYLNLIEHNKRAIGGALLRRLAEALEMPPGDLSGEAESRLLADLREIAADPLFAGEPLEAAEMTAALTHAPGLARALLTLYRAYRRGQDQIGALVERLGHDPALAESFHRLLTRVTSVRSFAEILQDYGDLDAERRQRFTASLVDESHTLSDLVGETFALLDASAGRHPEPAPGEEVEDFLLERGNHLPELEAAAEALRPAIDRSGGLLLADVMRHLESRHGVTVQRVAPEALATVPADGAAVPRPAAVQWDPERRRLALSQALPPASSRFLAAGLIAELELKAEIEHLLDDAALSTPESRRQGARALIGYAAGALMLPYAPFLATARQVRFDIELLQQHFAVSWEQVCHRLTTLRRPGDEGIPFHLLRTDIAGNISKRFSTSGLSLPRFGGVCPRWCVHSAFLTPDHVTTQLARLPDGATHLFVARAVSKAGGGFRAPRRLYSVLIGCDVAFARQTVYADGLALDTPAAATPVGLTCRQCPRPDCAQRAHPAALPFADSAP
ncbi:helix-turn-helix domain-containing protein [Roseospirillum parvum]|uniref:HTH cro/C1-type domain-containing protein n=1 Tax=Roseospirillum parvum TaxID=83401 RepID=A0A1G7WST3_9PROT|nr:helix-turn-helix transcriptional regulator [Roseospirillum parvum]SDG74969.1 hypothetical protein SAMN05421742_102308 [Roseospirillum parvum]